MPEFWYSTAQLFAARPALVLDASAAGQPFAVRQFELVRSVLATLPPDDWPDLFVFGSSEPLPAADFARRGEAWFAGHEGRGRVVGPVFAAIAHRPDPPVAVFAAGRIFDLPDWHGFPVAD